jgi:hypothetical protein
VDLASVIFAAMSDLERDDINERAAHVREALTGYRSGSAKLPAKVNRGSNTTQVRR